MDLKVLCFIILGAVLLSLFISRPKEHMGPGPRQETVELDQRYESLKNRDESMYVATPNVPRPTQRNLINQYSNPYFSAREPHPVLAYQSSHDKGIIPANIGDPIRVPMISGPTGLYGEPSNFAGSLIHSRGSIPIESFRSETFGPYPGKPQGVPVPANSLKNINENYNPDIFRFSPLGLTGTTLRGYAQRPSYIETQVIPVIEPGSNLPYQAKPTSGDFYRPYGPNIPVADVPFVGSVNSYAPLPEVNSPWEKSGILTSTRDDAILNLYRRPIAPAQNLWEYQVQDKNGFVIRLQNVKYVEDGDLIEYIPGKSGMGPWKVHDFVQNKYIWV